MSKKVKEISTIAEIEEVILAAGSDHLPTFGGRFEGGVHCQQVPDEFARAVHAILSSGREINNYLEIGVASGGTTYLINHFFHPAKMVLVDDNKHRKAGLRVQVLADIKQAVEVIGDSKAHGTVTAVTSKATEFDLMVIDGDHTYPGVRGDADIYIPMLNSGGFLLLHDSALPAWGVLRLTAELKEDETLDFVGEFVSVSHPRPCGVALFRKK